MKTFAITFVIPALLLLALSATPTARLYAQSSPWNCVGPFGGQAVAIAVIGDVVVVSADHNGLFRSEDHGDHWERVGYRFRNDFIQLLLVHGSTLLAFGSDSYRSTDIGRTWEQIPSWSAFFETDACFIGDTLYASPHGGDVYRSTDDGTHWAMVGHAPGNWTSIVAANGSTLYFSADSGLYSSHDGGTTWDRVMVTPTGVSVRAFAAHDSILVASIGDDPSYISDRLYRSTNNGKTWFSAGIGVTADRIRSIVWDGREFFACGGYHGGVFRSTDGSTWSRIQGGFTDEINIIWVRGDTMFAGSGDGHDGGLYRSVDHGVTWKRINNGFTSRSIGSFAEFDGDLYATASNEGLFKSTNNGSNWERVNAPSLAFDDPTCVVTSYNAILVGMQYWGADVGGGIYRSTDRGTSWARVDPDLGGVGRIIANGNFLFTIAADRTSGIGLLCSSTDGGATWMRNTTTFPFESVADIGFVGNTIYAGTPTGVYRSQDTGITWTAASTGIANLGKRIEHITAIGRGYNVILAGTVYYADNAAIYRSTDNGGTWQPVCPNGDTLSISAFAAYGSTLFASTYGGGVLRSVDNGASWQPFNEGLPKSDVESIAFHGGALFAGTSSGGIFRTSSPLGVERGGGTAGAAAMLAYPNPCRGGTTIRYSVPESEANPRVNVVLFDGMGHEVRRLLDARQTPGTYLINIDAAGLAAGTYFCRLQIGSQRTSRSFVLLGE
ncbi:MAG: T9SS type A sorting domain-containing protein [Bacteroidetes bacterium]|nr:T9SS type A sorting domain-containing protein [Bacteroidota bacterium]